VPSVRSPKGFLSSVRGNQARISKKLKKEIRRRLSTNDAMNNFVVSAMAI
jgi:hypothetical protein